MPVSRRRLVDITAAAIFLVVIAVLFWPSGGGDDANSAPDGVAEDLVSPTPEVTPPEEPDAEETETAQCDPENSARLLARFVTHVNDGDLDAIRGVLPERGADSPTTAVFPAMEQDTLHTFRVHESGALTNPDDVVAYLEQRHDSGESWRLEDYSFSRISPLAGEDRPELDRGRVVIDRISDDLPPHELEGQVIIDCEQETVLLWEFTTDHIDLALPISIDHFLSTVGPYGAAEMRELRMLVSTDLREDGGTMRSWDTRRIDANSAAGNYVQAVRVSRPGGEEVIHFVYDGGRWFLEQRGWHESGTLTGWDVLPLEMMLPRQEPAMTASLIRDHRDEIPEEGSYQITGEFEVRESLQRTAERIPGTGEFDGVLEVEIEDNRVVLTRYRLVDRQAGISASVPEIRWIEIERREQYEPALFDRPDEFNSEERQFDVPADLADQVTFLGELDHPDGIGERYELEWNGETVSLTVLPSRGASDQDTYGEVWPVNWSTRLTEIDGWTLVSAGPDDSAPFPHAAVWDTGDRRFELSVDADELNDPATWDAGVVEAIARALTGIGE